MDMDELEDYLLPLTKKLSIGPKPIKYHALCIWSDLLGFGAPFKENDWELTDKQWEGIAKRLLRAQREFVGNNDIMSKMLILNDGLGCVLQVDQMDLSHISCFIMLKIRAHMAINTQETKSGYPGTRTVMAYGDGVRYSPSEIRLDDYVFPYTRKDPNELSQLAKETGNPIVVFNPNAFQMNTAFSKAFLIDEAGSESGVTGNGFYIDQSFFDFVNSRIEHENQIFWHETDQEIEYKVYVEPETKNYVYFGFRMSKGIHINSKGLNTTVFKVNYFSPPDEPLPFEMSLDEEFPSSFMLLEELRTEQTWRSEEKYGKLME